MKSKTTLIAIAASLAFFTYGNAATILWGAAQNIAGDTDVSTLGTSVLAANFVNASGSSQTVNGVTFATTNNTASINGGGVTMTASGYANTRGPTTFTTTLTPFSGLSSGYQALLGSAYDLESTNGGTWTVSLTGLTVGQSYQVQMWANDPRAGGSTTRTSTYDGNTVKLNATETAGTPGQYRLGTFVANSTSQSITIGSTIIGANNSAMVSALQVRNITNIPEPTTAILAAGGLGIALLRRRS